MKPLARIQPGRLEIASRAHAASGIICHAGRLLADAAHALDGGDKATIRRAARRLDAQRPLLALALDALDLAVAAGRDR